MKNKYFNALNYTLGDEDTSLELDLCPRYSKNIFSIAGSGGRILPLFAKEPICLNCVDILKEQLYITELRIETVKALNHEEFCTFWGYSSREISPLERQKIFNQITISDEARSFLHTFFEQNKWGKIIYMGKFEKMLIQLSKINNLITGKKGRGIFFSKSLEEQKSYFYNSFPHLRWKIVLLLLGNSTILNSILYKGDFPKKNIKGSTYQNFARIFLSIFENISVRDSFFVQMAFWGNLNFKEGYLIEANPELYEQIKQGACKASVNYIQGNIFDVIKNSSEKATFLSLSDVPSFLKGKTEETYLQEISSKIEQESLVVVRGNLRVTSPISDDYSILSHQYDELIKKETTQLWNIQIYKKN
jgi:S-adenosylmethionine-diacylglycerol 3-amino-3-carboxypropyl transferase